MRSAFLSAAAVAIAGALQTLPLALPQAALAQSTPVLPSIPASETVTVQAEITAIDASKRAVRLADPSGQTVTVIAGPDVRLELLKVGDKVNARYVRSVAFVVTSPTGGNGVPTSDDRMTSILAQNAVGPGGLALRLTKISGTVVSIDLAASTLEIVNPSGGGVYTIHVTDPERVAKLPQLKVGDTITAVVSEALAVSIEPAPKS